VAYYPRWFSGSLSYISQGVHPVGESLEAISRIAEGRERARSISRQDPSGLFEVRVSILFQYFPSNDGRRPQKGRPSHQTSRYWQLLTFPGIAVILAVCFQGETWCAKVVKGSKIEMTSPADRANEAELVERLRNGDPTAMEQLFNTYFDRLYSLVFHEVGRDQAVAEDVTQEIFLNALTSIGKFRGQSKLYTWLCSIAHHKIADFYRRQERERKYSKQASGAIGPEQIADTGRPVPSMTESEETRHAVEQALLKLPLDYRQVLILKYVEEMSVREISQIVQRSPKSVEGLLARARKALRDYLVASGEGFR